MQMYPSQFPPKRRRKATRRAELRIFNALASSNLAGFSYYEWRKDFDDLELDFAVWMRDHGRAALQVKGGGLRAAPGRVLSAHPGQSRTHRVISHRRSLARRSGSAR